ncbi:MAG: cytochrome c1 [Inquilinus sp.]|nr:cytochrome c1 [Inquilinus sp.]
MKTLFTAIGAGAIALSLFAGPTVPARAAEGASAPPDLDWSFEGFFGTYDRGAAQRGLQVYFEACAGCHSMDLLAYRNLGDLGYDEEEVKAIAAQYFVIDGPDGDGEMFERPALPSDKFVSPYANEQQARLFNNGAYPPDLSLIAKARLHGPDYLAALLTGYEDTPPDGSELMPGMSYNAYFPGHQIAMPQVLYDDGIGYADGTPPTAAQQARDVATFLMWAAEPKLEDRNRMGVKVVLYLIVFAGVMYGVKRRVWAKLH